MKTQNSYSIYRLILNESGNIVYKGVDLEITPDQLFDIRTQIGMSTKDAVEVQYQSIIQKRRCDNLEILLD